MLRNIIVRSPTLTTEFDEYYKLRWQLLRAPWNQPKGSEKDELEENAIHRIAIKDEKIIALARLHQVDESTAQIRYMAVLEKYINNGVGTTVLKSLEKYAIENNINNIILHSRECAVSFYKKNNYQLIKKSHLLYKTIQHYEMHKNFI